MAQRLEELETLYNNLKTLFPLKPDISFDKNSWSVSMFNLTDNGKTATLISKGFSGLEILPQIPSSGEHCYSLRINKTKGDLIFGILTNENNPPAKGGYAYSTFNGKIFGRIDQEAIGDGPFGSKNSILRMIVNMDQGTLAFYAGNRQVNFCDISKSDTYYAFVCFSNTGDSVVLL